ncbi:MAG: MarR family transcriptional regulator [Candidatus Bathyarchaeota archaeon]|nr:MAG: MarR family transcriptional regulator [Candidatus Bathyarchaeota archaeon]
MIEYMIFLGVFSALSITALVIYGRRIHEATEHYRNAREVISDILVSFNKQFKDQETKLNEVVDKASDLSRKHEENKERLKAYGTQIKALRKTDNSSPEIQQTTRRIDSLEAKFKEIENSRERILDEISSLKKQRQSTRRQDLKIESAIPIGRERALSPLTPTELAVLQLLASEGEKSAPEVKERIRLSREHTARLMKKLYEKGYVDRRSGKMPFVYLLKEEMRKLLRKTEQSS